MRTLGTIRRLTTAAWEEASNRRPGTPSTRPRHKRLLARPPNRPPPEESAGGAVKQLRTPYRACIPVPPRRVMHRGAILKRKSENKLEQRLLNAVQAEALAFDTESVPSAASARTRKWFEIRLIQCLRIVSGNDRDEMRHEPEHAKCCLRHEHKTRFEEPGRKPGSLHDRRDPCTNSQSGRREAATHERHPGGPKSGARASAKYAQSRALAGQTENHHNTDKTRDQGRRAGAAKIKGERLRVFSADQSRPDVGHPAKHGDHGVSCNQS